MYYYAQDVYENLFVKQQVYIYNVTSDNLKLLKENMEGYFGRPKVVVERYDTNMMINAYKKYKLYNYMDGERYPSYKYPFEASVTYGNKDMRLFINWNYAANDELRVGVSNNRYGVTTTNYKQMTKDADKFIRVFYKSYIYLYEKY